MKNLLIKRLLLPMPFLLLVAAGTAWGDVVNIGDASFENAVTPAGTYSYGGPACLHGSGCAIGTSAWTYSDHAVLVGNGSGFGNPNAPDGVQAVALQDASAAHGEISQVLTGLNKGGSVTFTFDAAARTAQDGANEIGVYLNGAMILDLSQGSLTGSYQAFTTNAITITSTSETLTFAGLTDPSGDHTTFIDNVTGMQTAAVPEAGLYGVLAIGLSGLLIAFRRRKIA